MLIKTFLNLYVFFLFLLISYKLFKLSKHPNYSFPKLKFKRIQLFPSIKIEILGRIIHVHHWVYLSMILIITIAKDYYLISEVLTKGFLTGGILQGLTSSDRLKIVYKEDK